MEKKVKTKRLNDRDPETWGIKPHWNIPPQVIDRMATPGGFSMRHVKSAAERYFERIKLGIENSPGVARSDLALPMFYRDIVHQSLALLEGAKFSYMVLGQLIEYCIVADKLEAWLKERKTSRSTT